ASFKGHYMNFIRVLHVIIMASTTDSGVGSSRRSLQIELSAIVASRVTRTKYNIVGIRKWRAPGESVLSLCNTSYTSNSERSMYGVGVAAIYNGPCIRP